MRTSAARQVALLTAVAVLAGLALLAGSGAATYAAHGKGKLKPLLLGHTNKARKTTTLTNKKAGPALALNTTPGSPPLAVNSDTLVPHLNADSVDGLDSSAMVNPATKRFAYTNTTETQTSPTLLRVGRLQPGSYLVTLRASMLPVSGSANNPTDAQCQFMSGTTPYGGDSGTYVGQFSVLLGTADVVTTSTPLDLDLVCATGFARSFTFFQPLQVTVTPVTDAGATPLTEQLPG